VTEPNRRTQVEPSERRTVSISVIVPAYRSWSTLPTVLTALRDQIEPEDREAILVESSAERTADELQAHWPWLRAIVLSERALPGRARNIGLREASADVIVFLDADAVPERDWLDELARALTPDVDVVAGAVLNGTPRSVTGTAGYWLEFSDWLPGRRGAPLHGPTCNLLVRRRVLVQSGGFREDLLSGEDTILTMALGRAGRLAFAPKARVRHLNKVGIRPYLSHQRSLGLSFAAVAREGGFPRASFARRRLVPLTPFFRLVSVGRRLAAHPREAVKAVLLMPVLAAGAVSWAVGLADGYRSER
jgi:GT2 family glycosyltransferase